MFLILLNVEFTLQVLFMVEQTHTHTSGILEMGITVPNHIRIIYMIHQVHI
jgi:hypothetical protein